MPVALRPASMLTLGALLVMGEGGVWEKFASASVSSAAIAGQVVAEDIGIPLQGVAIFPFWSGSKMVPLAYADPVKILETESRENGAFVLPPRGPFARPESLSAISPVIVCFLPGFKPMRIELGRLSPEGGARPIQLRRFDGTPKQWAEALASVVWNLAYAVALLEGLPTPKMLTAVETEWRRLPKDVAKDLPGARKMFAWLVQEFRRAFDSKSWEQR